MLQQGKIEDTDYIEKFACAHTHTLTCTNTQAHKHVYMQIVLHVWKIRRNDHEQRLTFQKDLSVKIRQIKMFVHSKNISKVNSSKRN